MWIYQQSTGKLWEPYGRLVAIGYAGGAGGKRPEAVNNPSMQDIKGVGPLPHGKFKFGTPVEHSQLGPFAIPLIPDAKNEMFGRDGFYMHGDTPAMDHSASDGCIIQARDVREDCWNSDDHDLVVIV